MGNAYSASITADFQGKKSLLSGEEYEIIFNKQNYLLDDIELTDNVTYLMKAVVDHNNVIIESNENNNSLTKTIIITSETISQPKLKASTANVTPELSAIAGKTEQLFTNIILDATGSSEDIKVTHFNFVHKTSKAGTQSYITNIALYDYNTRLNTPVSGVQSNSTATNMGITLTQPLIIPKGTSKSLNLRGTISGSAENGTTHQFNINDGNGIMAYGNSSGDVVTETANYPLNGILVTISTYGQLNISNHSANPGTSIILADSTSNIGLFNFGATGEDVEIEKITFDISGSVNAYHNIDWLQLYSGSTKLGEVQVTGSSTNIIPSNLVIPENGSNVLTLKAITHKVGLLESGNSGEKIKVTISGIDAKGVASGSTSIIKSGINLTSTNNQYIFKTFPVISKISLSGMENGTQDLYKFNVMANSKGEVGLYKFTFSINKNSVDIYNLKLYEISGGSEIVLTLNPVAVADEVKMYIESDMSYRIVSAGSSKTYVLRGDVTGWDVNASLVVKLLGDGGNVLEPNTAKGLDNDPNNNFIWSDLNFGYNTSSSTSSAEWFNGALISSFDNTSSNKPPATPVAPPVPVVSPTPAVPVTSPTKPVQQITQTAKRLGGRLLLQVQQGGAIWYVDDINYQRHNITWKNALSLFQKFAIGITNEDLLKIPVDVNSIDPNLDTDGDSYKDRAELQYGFSPYIPGAYQGKFSTSNSFANRLRGKFLLQTQQGGAIWYVDQNGIRHNVRWDNLEDLFKSLSLGITNSDLNQIFADN